jgi:hypothetical protein
MNTSTHLTITNIHARTWLTRVLARNILFLILFVLAWLPLAPTVQAVSPTPDGAYSGANTAEGGSGALFSLTTGTNNTALGSQALFSLKYGSQNTAIGSQALMNNFVDGNTATGFQALSRNNTGGENTANGWRALFTNTTGSSNTADGSGALYSNTVGSQNTADGFQALYDNRTGSRNTACGYQAILGGGNDNTALGAFALGSGASSGGNTALGSGALRLNTAGSGNTATGGGALSNNTTGSNNTADGAGALSGNYNFGTGSCNTAVGAGALVGGAEGEFQNNTVVGAQALPLPNGGQNNIAIGYRAGVNVPFGDNNIEIGNAGDPVSGDGNTIRIGDMQTATFIAGIYQVNEGGTILPVYINSNGQLGTTSSSRRFKKEIQPMDKASEAILALKPVTFQYKNDSKGVPQFGLIAEEVAQVNPDLVVRDAHGEVYTVRYEAVNAMLLNEFLKEHRRVEEQGCKAEEQNRKIQEQETMIAQFKATVAQQQKDFQAAAAHEQKQIEVLTAGLERVSAQVEMSRPAPQMVFNNR